MCLSSQPVEELGFGMYSQYSFVMLVIEALVDHSYLVDLLVLCCSFSFTFIGGQLSSWFKGQLLYRR